MKYWMFFTILFMSFNSTAQELLCNVEVVAPKVQNAEPRIFESLKNAVEDFMNSRRWTNDNFEIEERIECSILITIDELNNNTNFSGKIQITANRPVFETSYNCPILNINDLDFDFVFVENSMLQFTPDQHGDNLTSVLAFYAYYVLGTDYDSFSLEGGTENFTKAQRIVTNAANAAQSGWRANESNKNNRYWLIENVLHQSFKPLRIAYYKYHRFGFDKLYSNYDGGLKEIISSIRGLRSVHQIKPGSYNLQAFFNAKSLEIVSLFQEADPSSKNQVYSILKMIDPANIAKYEAMMGRG